jgi:hypothetical protein
MDLDIRTAVACFRAVGDVDVKKKIHLLSVFYILFDCLHMGGFFWRYRDIQSFAKRRILMGTFPIVGGMCSGAIVRNHV